MTEERFHRTRVGRSPVVLARSRSFRAPSAAMRARPSSGRMFNNYAIVQGVDHIVPVDIYLPGCPPRPEMLMDAIVKLHDKIQNMKLGANRERQITDLEQARLSGQERPQP